LEFKYNLNDLKKMAETLAESISPPFSYLLEGDVGAGKTTFSQFFIRSIVYDKLINITSPTFNIVHVYETIKGPVWHVDLYRLKSFAEVGELGLFDAMRENICLIEWPDLIRGHCTNYAYRNILF
jgi:tRNA threonylcarbamoyladenosine biosynthesis protein TsaE